MLSNTEVLELVIQGYERLKMVAEERGMSVDDLVIRLREHLSNGKNGNKFAVKIKEVRELTELDLDATKFYPIQKERKRLVAMAKIKVK